MGAGWAASMIRGARLWPLGAQGAQRSARRSTGPSSWHHPPRAVSPHGPCTVGRRLPQAFPPPLLSPTQQGAPSISAQPRSATTSVPGTDRSWTSRRVTLSRSLTRRGSKAGGEGRSTAGWVRAEHGISGSLAFVCCTGIVGWRRWGVAHVGGFPWFRGGKGIVISLLVQLAFIFWAPTMCQAFCWVLRRQKWAQHDRCSHDTQSTEEDKPVTKQLQCWVVKIAMGNPRAARQPRGTPDVPWEHVRTPYCRASWSLRLLCLSCSL